MKAVTVVKSGVQIINVDTPSPKDSEVLVKVHACGLNRADLVVADGGAHGAAGGPQDLQPHHVLHLSLIHISEPTRPY